MAEVNKKNLKAISRLIEHGVTTEKDVLALGLAQLLQIPNISVQELGAICELQKAIKNNKVFSYLASATGEVSDEA